MTKKLIDGYEEYLLKYTNLQPSTVLKYVIELKNFYKLYPEDTLKNIINFVIVKSTASHNNRAKYAMKLYLEYRNRGEQYKKIPRLKKPLKVHMASFYSGKQVYYDVIKNMPQGVYRDMSIVQLAIGCRVSEVLGMREEFIDLDNNRIMLRVKGGKNREVFIDDKQQIKIILKNYMKGSKGFMFIPRSYNDFTGLDMERVITSYTKKYNYRLKKAAKKAGYPKFSSHDLRRAFAKSFQEITADIYALQKALGHANINTTELYLPPQGINQIANLKKVGRNIFGGDDEEHEDPEKG